MVLETITDLRGLGFKDWTKYKLDPSDEDGGTYKSKTDIYISVIQWQKRKIQDDTT